jgi:hypothetical protein
MWEERSTLFHEESERKAMPRAAKDTKTSSFGAFVIVELFAPAGNESARSMLSMSPDAPKELPSITVAHGRFGLTCLPTDTLETIVGRFTKFRPLTPGHIIVVRTRNRHVTIVVQDPAPRISVLEEVTDI